MNCATQLKTKLQTTKKSAKSIPSGGNSSSHLCGLNGMNSVERLGITALQMLRVTVDGYLCWFINIYNQKGHDARQVTTECLGKPRPVFSLCGLGGTFPPQMRSVINHDHCSPQSPVGIWRFFPLKQ